MLGNLQSKNDLVRDEATDGYRRLAMTCNKVEAIEGLLKQIFEILNGSNGKINVLEHKISVLKVSENIGLDLLPTSKKL